MQPLWDMSAAYIALHNVTAARAVLAEATARQPRNPQTFLQLAQFDLRFHAPQAALAELQTAVALGAPTTQANPLIAETQAALNAQHARAAAAAKKAARRRSGR